MRDFARAKPFNVALKEWRARRTGGLTQEKLAAIMGAGNAPDLRTGWWARACDARTRSPLANFPWHKARLENPGGPKRWYRLSCFACHERGRMARLLVRESSESRPRFSDRAIAARG